MENQPSMRALIVNDDTSVLKSSAMMLSDVLNFQVATCKSPARALRLIAGQKLKDVDVVLIDAVKGTTCGFDFREIVEPHYGIPVVYCLPRDPHVGASGEEVDEQQQLYTAAMQALPAMYTLKTPLDASVLLGLPEVIELRKSCLQLPAKAKGKKDGGNLELPAAVQEILAASTSVEGVEEDDEHIHFTAPVARAEGRGQLKRKGSSNLAADGSSGSGAAAGGQLTAKRIKRQERMNLREGQRGDDGVAASHQQVARQKQGAKKASKKGNGGMGSKIQQTHVKDVARSSSSVPFTCACAKTAAARAAAAAVTQVHLAPAQATSPHTVSSPPPAAQAPPPVNPAPLPAPVPELPPVVHQPQEPVMGSMAPLVAAPTMAAPRADRPQLPRLSQPQPQQEDVSDPSLMFNPFPDQGPRSPVPSFQQPLADDDVFMSMAASGMVAAAPPSTGATGAGVYENAPSTTIQFPAEALLGDDVPMQDTCLEGQPGSTIDSTTTAYAAEDEGLDILNEFLAMGTSCFPNT